MVPPLAWYTPAETVVVVAWKVPDVCMSVASAELSVGELTDRSSRRVTVQGSRPVASATGRYFS